MPGSQSTQSSTSQGTSTSTPTVVQTPQSQWELQLSQMLGNIGQQQYAWAQGAYAQMSGITDQQINNFLNLSRTGSDLAGNTIGRYSGIFAPMEDQYAQEAAGYTSEGRLRHNMGRAESASAQGSRQGVLNAERELQSYGIDPSSGRYADLVAAANTNAGAAAAAAGEQARQYTEDTGRQMRVQAIQMGEQMPAAAVNELNSAYQGVAGAQNAALGRANTGVNLMDSAAPYFNAAMSLKYPPVGQNTTSQQTGQSQGSSTSQSPNPQQQAQQRPGSPSGPGPGPGGPSTYNPMGGPPGQNTQAQTARYGAPPSAGTMQIPDAGTYDQNENPNVDWTNPYNPWGVSSVYDTNNWDQSANQYADQGDWASTLGSTYTGDLTTPQANWGDQADYSNYDASTAGANNYDYSNYGAFGDDNYGYEGYRRGGAIPSYAAGGGMIPASMSPSGGRQTDDVQAVIPQTGGRAQLNANEFVIPRDVALWKGQEFFQNLIKKSREARVGAPAKPQMNRGPQPQPQGMAA